MGGEESAPAADEGESDCVARRPRQGAEEQRSRGADSVHRSCKPREILTFGCAALILTHDKLFSMSRVTPILNNMYITHNNTHMGP